MQHSIPSRRDRTFVSIIHTLIVLLVLSASSAGIASAQTSLGTIRGTITEPDDSIAFGATVTITNADTGLTRITTTNDQGLYNFDAVDLGTYNVVFSFSGFSGIEKTNIIVSANQTATVDVKLLVGTQVTTVDVQAEPGTTLQIEAPVRGGNISQQSVTDLPFANRNPVSLAGTLPGVSSNRGGFGDNTFSVNGARSRSNNFLIDGTENNDISVAGQGFHITNPDAVREVSVQTSNYDSEFGRSGGAVVNVITRSGTNNFHGTLSYLLDSRVDDAITSSESRDSNIKANGLPFGIQNVYSGTLGGPIRSNRTFFFAAYQQDRRRSNTQSQLTAPTAIGRTQLRQVFPAGASANADTYLSATQNTIGLSAPFNIALGTVNGIDRGNVEFGGYFRSFKVLDTDKQFQIRVDNKLKDRDNVTVRFLMDRDDQPFGGTIGTATFEGFDADSISRYYNFLVADTHIFSPTLTNEARIAYNRIDLGFPLSDSTGPAATLPRITVQLITALGASSSFPQGRIANNYVGQDTVSWSKGKHTLRVGIDFLRQISTQAAPYNPRGTITFAASTPFSAFANYMDNFGGSGSAARDIGSAVYFPSLYRTAAFFQDRWRATKSLTLSLGLRYEYFGTPFNTLQTPAFTGLFNVDPTTRLGPYGLPNEIQADRNNFAPSIGLAYSPTNTDGLLGALLGGRKSVLRAGYQLGYDSFFNNIASNAAVSSPNIVATTITSTINSANPRGTANFLSAIPTTAAALTPLSSQTLMAPNLVNPYYQHWSAGIQRELPRGVVVEVSYVGSKGTKLYINEDANPLVRPELRLGTPVSYPACTPGANVTAAQATTDFPAGVLCPLSGRYDNLQGARLIRTNGGSSKYHAGQLEVRRRFGNNFSVNGAYTFSKMLSNGDEVFNSLSAGIANAQSAQTPLIFGGDRDERGLSLFDRTHRASITTVIELPFMKSQQGVVGHLVGGFEVSGVAVFESGVPYTVANGSDADGIGGAAVDRPNINSNGRKGVRAVPQVDAQGFITGYVNPEMGAAIDPNTAYFIGNPTYVAGLAGSVPRVGTLGRNTERTPGLNNINLNILKRTNITETTKIEFRTEFYNIFNHPQYGTASVSPFAPAGNPQGSNFIPASVNTSTAGQFLNPNTASSDGGGRVIRFQLKFIF